MYSRVALKAVSMAAVPITATVYAADLAEGSKDTPPETKVDTPSEKVTVATSNKMTDNRIFVNQLPLYGDPSTVELVYTPEKVGVIQENIVPVREVLLIAIQRCEKLINFVSSTQKTASANIKDYVRYLQEDSGALPRAAFITVAGFGGIVAGYKGGVVRKTLYTGLGMGGASSICYPEQAIDLSKRGWLLSKTQAMEIWKQMRSPDTKEEDKPVSIAEKVEEKASENIDKLTKTSTNQDSKDIVKVAGETETSSKTKPKEDHGMSKSEDKAMYSTRSS